MGECTEIMKLEVCSRVTLAGFRLGFMLSFMLGAGLGLRSQHPIYAQDQSPSIVHDIAGLGSVVYVATDLATLVLDISDPDRPQELARIPGEHWDLWLQADRLYVRTGSLGTRGVYGPYQVYDVSMPWDPVLEHTVFEGGSVWIQEISGQKAITLEEGIIEDDPLRVFRRFVGIYMLDEEGRPDKGFRFALDFDVFPKAVAWPFLYAQKQDALVAYDLRDPHDHAGLKAPVARVKPVRAITDARIVDSRLYVRGEGSLQAFDLAPDGAMQEAWGFWPAHATMALAADQDMVYLAIDKSGSGRKLLSIDAHTGDLIAEFDSNAWPATMHSTDTMIVLGSRTPLTAEADLLEFWLKPGMDLGRPTPAPTLRRPPNLLDDPLYLPWTVIVRP